MQSFGGQQQGRPINREFFEPHPLGQAAPGAKGPGPGPGGAPAVPGFVPSHLQDNPYLAEQYIAEELYKAGRGPNPNPQPEPEPPDALAPLRLQFAEDLFRLEQAMDAEFAQAQARQQLVAGRQTVPYA